MKGIVLAGGSGSRLYPLTEVISKQLLPVHDKPMIYYPISTLMLAGIQDILIISTPTDLPLFEKLLGDGSRFGITLSYLVQPAPEGLAQSFIIGKEFIGTQDVCLVLGDNIFYGQGFTEILKMARRRVENENKAVIFGYHVSDPERYGVASFDGDGNVIHIEEKPISPQSNFAVVGLYFYPNSVIDVVKDIQPSPRGELEITTLNQVFLNKNMLAIEKLGRGFAWLDTGTHESLSEATQFIHAIEKRQGMKVSCLEEIAIENHWLSKAQVSQQVRNKKSDYYQYIMDL